jgi:hypothetical protein
MTAQLQRLQPISHRRWDRFDDLIFILREHGIPLKAIDLSCLTRSEQSWIMRGYALPLREVRRRCINKVSLAEDRQ